MPQRQLNQCAQLLKPPSAHPPPSSNPAIRSSQRAVAAEMCDARVAISSPRISIRSLRADTNGCSHRGRTESDVSAETPHLQCAAIPATRRPYRCRMQRVALVTGSSRGLGSTIARRLARDGVTVAVNDAHGDPGADEVVSSIRSDGGVAQAFVADVTDESDVKKLVAAITETLGPI